LEAVYVPRRKGEKGGRGAAALNHVSGWGRCTLLEKPEALRCRYRGVVETDA